MYLCCLTFFVTSNPGIVRNSGDVDVKIVMYLELRLESGIAVCIYEMYI